MITNREIQQAEESAMKTKLTAKDADLFYYDNLELIILRRMINKELAKRRSATKMNRSPFRFV